jgi:predicted ATPase with chaperone activity
VRSGIASAELEWPLRRITVNLAPAALRKEGSGFDLPIALAVLAASRQLPPETLDRHAAIGELALDGRIRPVGGVLAVAEGGAPLDRFDLVVAVPRPRARELGGAPGEPSAAVAPRVAVARARLRREPVRLTREADELLARAVERLPLSGRGRARVARVAQTAAALAGAERAGADHVAEALSYRAPSELLTR